MAVTHLVFCFVLLLSRESSASPPNIVFIVADDYGYNDIGYHGSELKTPALDELAEQGVKLENYYVQPICSPTRSSLLTGRYPIRSGLQHEVIRPCTPSGLPLEEKTLPDKLKEEGYKTHIVGKWHLGFYKQAYMPTNRGFDTFFGHLLGAEDFYTHYRPYNVGDTEVNGLDFRENLEPYNQSYGDYSTHMFTERAQKIIEHHDASEPLFLYLPYQSVHSPLQVPSEYEEQFAYITDPNRRTYAGMVAAMDEGIRNVTETLKSTGLWNNTLLVFTTDNGGEVFESGNNAPLRGSKWSYFEGGIKAIGFVSGPVLKNAGTVNHQLMHVSDWFPTLVTLAGGSVDYTGLDGYDQWETIANNKTSPRLEILHNIDPSFELKGVSASDVFDTSVQASLRYGDYKILTGDPGFDKWVPSPTSNLYKQPEYARLSSATQNVYLFDVVKDPEERHDLSQSEPAVVKRLLERLAYWNTTAVPVNFPPADLSCDPALHGGVWGPWMDDDTGSISQTSTSQTTTSSCRPQVTHTFWLAVTCLVTISFLMLNNE